MRVLITGSRNWIDREMIKFALFALLSRDPTADIVIVHGGAEGADTIAAELAELLEYEVEPPWLPDYDKYPRQYAPLARNDAMLDSGVDLVLAFMLGRPEQSGGRGGTLYTVNGARDRGIPTIVHHLPGDM